jgi:hypothetical protein
MARRRARVQRTLSSRAARGAERAAGVLVSAPGSSAPCLRRGGTSLLRLVPGPRCSARRCVTESAGKRPERWGRNGSGDHAGAGGGAWAGGRARGHGRGRGGHRGGAAPAAAAGRRSAAAADHERRSPQHRCRATMRSSRSSTRTTKSPSPSGLAGRIATQAHNSSTSRRRTEARLRAGCCQ